MLFPLHYKKEEVSSPFSPISLHRRNSLNNKSQSTTSNQQLPSTTMSLRINTKMTAPTRAYYTPATTASAPASSYYTPATTVLQTPATAYFTPSESPMTVFSADSTPTSTTLSAYVTPAHSPIFLTPVSPAVPPTPPNSPVALKMLHEKESLEKLVRELQIKMLQQAIRSSYMDLFA